MDILKVVNIYSIVTSLIWLLIFICIYIKIGNENKSLAYYIRAMIFFIIFLILGIFLKEDRTLIGIIFLDISYVLLIFSTEVFIPIINKKIWIYSFAGSFILIILSEVINSCYNCLFNIYIGVLLIYIGCRLLKTKKNDNYLIGSFLILWGLFKLACPILCKVYNNTLMIYIINRIFFVFSEAIFMVAYVYKIILEYRLDNKNIKNIFNASTVGLELYNSQAELIIINPICLEMFEIKNHKTVIGSNLFERFNIADRSLEPLKKGQDVSFRVEFTFNRENSDSKIITGKKYLEVKINILGNNKSMPDGYLVQIEDISAQIYSSHELEERLKMAVRSAKLYGWDWYIKTNELYVDPMFAQSLGYDINRFNDNGQTFFESINKEDIQNINNNLKKHLENTDQIYVSEWRIKDANGDYRWFMATGSIIERDDIGTPIRMVGIYQCIEERKRSEIELYNSERRYRKLFKTMVNGYARLESKYGNNEDIRDYKCIEANNCLNEILEKEELRGKNITEIISHEMYWIQLFNKMLKKNNNRSSFEEYSRKLGKILQITIHRFDKDQMILIIRDVTTERNLENMVRQTEKLSAIGQLVGGIAHDFNNQLMAIGGAVSIIKTKYADEEGMKYINYIEKCSNNSASLINRLLTFSRETKYKLVPVDIHNIINSVVEILERSIDKKIQIETLLNADNHMILGDESQIQNAILNIGINARDALIDGGQLVFRTYNIVDINCEHKIDEKQQPAIVIVVSDNGIGMDEEVKKRLFEPFFTTKDIDKGTGMGLTMVFGVIKNHGGCISVNSVIDVGTDFTIKLPVLDEKAYVPKDEHEEILQGKGKILVVDDEEIIRELLKEMLEMLGYSVVMFGDGYDAIDYYEKNSNIIDLVLLDVVMPKIDGKELLSKLYGINNNAKIGFLSGYGKEKMDESIMGKIVGFITKPINIEELSLKVKEMLNK